MNPKNFIKKYIFTIAFLLSPLGFSAEFKIHNAFTDNMILQRGKVVTVKGWAKAGEKVSLSFGKQNKSAIADKEGAWAIQLDPMPANSKAQDLSVSSAGKSLTLKNILIGDVWLFARQSTIDTKLRQTETGRKAAAGLKTSGSFRTLKIIPVPALQEEKEIYSKTKLVWQEVNGSNALKMDAAAFYFGNRLSQNIDVPVGIIDLEMGPYIAIGWMSKKAVEEAKLMHPGDKLLEWMPKHTIEQAEARESGEMAKKLNAMIAQKAKREKEYAGVEAPLGLHPLFSPIAAHVGYNAVIHPMRGMALKGVILQLGNDYPFVPYSMLDAEGKGQGRLELAQAWYETYKILKNGFRITPTTLPYISKDWRRTFNDETLPIGMITPPGSDLPVLALHGREIRELLRRVQKSNPNIGLILSGNQSIPLSAQPADNQYVAQGCYNWAMGAVYEKPGQPATGPVLEKVTVNLDKAVIHFKEGTAKGLKLAGNSADLFEVAGADFEFYPAKATIKDSTVTVQSEDVGMVLFVRYNWKGNIEKGLVNAAGLPAYPFNTSDNWIFAWIPPNPIPDLPEEYTLTADKWQKKDVAIINGSIKMPPESGPFPNSGDTEFVPSWIGPTGIYSNAFGPNLMVLGVVEGSPAYGKIKQRDIIYSANGKIFGPGDEKYKTLAAAITHSESEEAGGKLVLGVRRKGELMDVEIELEVMGSFSKTTPYYCPKSVRIVKKAEKWMMDRYRPENDAASNPGGFLNTDLLFLLASGNPECQGLVRRAIYAKIEKMDLTPPKEGDRASNWGLGHDAMLLGEYYHLTGDKNVLPYLEKLCAHAAITQLRPAAETAPEYEAAHTEMQVGGYRHKYPTAADRWKSGYGLLPHAGMGCIMGMLLAKEAGAKYDAKALQRGLKHFLDGKAEHAFNMYSYNNLRRESPAELDPEKEISGGMYSLNGKQGMVASLFNMAGDKATTWINSRLCTYAYNNTRSGHGGMFFNNFWTPIGAHLAGPKSFKHFMRGQTWWRELYRRYDGSYTQAGRGGIGVSYAMHRVAHHKRLRMLGAPISVFGGNGPDYLKPALAAHAKRDYKLALQLIDKELKERIIPADERPVVEHFRNSIQTLIASIDHDLDYVAKLLEKKRYYRASIELPQLKAVVAADNPKLTAILNVLESPEFKDQITASQKAENDLLREKRRQRYKKAKTEKWQALVEDKDGKNPNTWHMKVVETISQAPEGWTKPDFDASTWPKTTLPLSWRLYHTALYRTTFTVNNKADIEALRLRAGVFQQLNVVIYINGVKVAKIDDIGRGTGTITAPFTELALASLKDGENSIAISTRHNRRWGPARGPFGEAVGVRFMLDAKLKDK